MKQGRNGALSTGHWAWIADARGAMMRKESFENLNNPSFTLRFSYPNGSLRTILSPGFDPGIKAQRKDIGYLKVSTLTGESLCALKRYENLKNKKLCGTMKWCLR